MSQQQGLFAPGVITYDSKALEAHYTPDWLARYAVVYALSLGKLGITEHLRVYEPHGGGGAFLRAWAPFPVSVQSSDVDKNCWAVRHGGASVHDFLAMRPALVGTRFDLVNGNPPFSNAEEHAEHALRLAPWVVFILPMSRLETAKRQAFYAECLVEVVQLPERVWKGSRSIGIFAMNREVRKERGRTELILDPTALDPDGCRGCGTCHRCRMLERE